VYIDVELVGKRTYTILGKDYAAPRKLYCTREGQARKTTRYGVRELA
jgi:hypothetical protein